MNLRLTGYLAAALALPSLSLASTHSVGALDLLKDLRDKASDVAQHASELYSISPALHKDWQIDASKLQLIKDDVNSMGVMLSRLELLRDSSPAFEQKAIDEAVPLLKDLAGQAQSAIEFVNAHQGNLWVQEYYTKLGTMAKDSERLSRSLGQYVHFAKVSGKEKRLEQTLGVESGS